ncbi:DUF3907 family protein [Gorillibacterium timonense]|uniref:DUF3907 family protein n=1 Tax=Gorillibacterium timonense TaxID=1689269 RepID=UPI00071CE62B|nr:DUF3907 family protein [Gorillibacterium timonense]
MAGSDVKNLCESARVKLKEAISKMELFLNRNSLEQLVQGSGEADPAMEDFYRDYLQDTRHLLVFSEVLFEKLGVSLRRAQFQEDHAERNLYDAYHQCVNRFFYPKNECYSEDGRYAYTGQDAIRFRKKPNRDVRNLTVELSKIFEELREELSYYETDYINQKRMQGEKI